MRYQMHTLRSLGLAALLWFGLSPILLQAQSKADVGRARLEQARIYAAADDPRTEGEYRQAIADRGGFYPDAWRELSTYLARKQKFSEAADAFRKYLNQAQGRTNAGWLNRLEQASELKNKRDNSGESLNENERLELVRLIVGFASKDDAIPYAEEALKFHPESPLVLIALADLIRWKDKERSLEMLNRAVTFAPDKPVTYVARGWCQFWAFRNPVEAEKDFRRALEVSKGSDASAWAGLGDALKQQGRREEAIQAFQKYLSIRPIEAASQDPLIRQTIRDLKRGTSDR